jgi:hypothetical protein
MHLCSKVSVDPNNNRETKTMSENTTRPTANQARDDYRNPVKISDDRRK